MSIEAAPLTLLIRVKLDVNAVDDRRRIRSQLWVVLASNGALRVRTKSAKKKSKHEREKNGKSHEEETFDLSRYKSQS